MPTTIFRELGIQLFEFKLYLRQNFINYAPISNCDIYFLSWRYTDSSYTKTILFESISFRKTITRD